MASSSCSRPTSWSWLPSIERIMPRADGNARPPDGRPRSLAGRQVLWFATVSAGSRRRLRSRRDDLPGRDLPVSRRPRRARSDHRPRDRGGARRWTRSGQAIRYVRSIFIPDDEVCLLLFEAGSAEIVGEAARRAGLDPERITLADSRDRVVRS